MEFTKEQKNYLDDVYVNVKSSSDVFRKAHKADFIDSACDCTCSNSLSYENCNKKCKRYELEQSDL